MLKHEQDNIGMPRVNVYRMVFLPVCRRRVLPEHVVVPEAPRRQTSRQDVVVFLLVV